MPAPSSTHRALTEAAVLYCRFVYNCWPVGSEAVGLTNRNYDAIAIRSSPRGLVAFETKKSRKDFLSGIQSGQFNKSPYITELWLVTPGTFDISEAPHYLGLMSPRHFPICDLHEKTQKQQYCDEKCKRPKTIFLKIDRLPRPLWDKDLTSKYWNLYTTKWLWRIAVSNSTKYINIIAANMVPNFSEGMKHIKEIKKDDGTGKVKDS
jgi:hypothetical protein